MKRGINWKVLIISVISVALVAFLGSLFTSKNTNSALYESIKPSITPPNFIFPIVWTILFILIAVSLYFVWINANTLYKKEKILFTFSINFILNVLWSLLYFGLKNPGNAFIDIIFLDVSILGMIFVCWKINKLSAYLLLHYLFWCLFASVLNFMSI